MKVRLSFIVQFIGYWGLLLLMASIIPVGGFFLVRWIYDMGQFASFLSGVLTIILLVAEGFVVRILFYMFLPDNF
jgi:hypothetical protein